MLSLLALALLAVVSAQVENDFNPQTENFSPQPENFPTEPQPSNFQPGHHSNFQPGPSGNFQPNQQRNFQQSPQGNNCWGQPEQLRSHHQIPREYLQAHHRFTSDLLKHPGFWANVHHNGVSATNSFTLGHLLTLLGQETFDLPTQNIPRVLRVPSIQNAGDSYSQQYWNWEEEDNHVYPTSYLFTPYENLRTPPGFELLFSRKFITNLWKNPNAPDNINELVRVATRDYIHPDQLVPSVPPFHEQTAGVFVNTFHFANDWKNEWTKIGKYNFNTPNGAVPVENYEYNGAFPVLETQGYTAVAVPLEGNIKHVVFVLPNNDLKDYFSQGYVDEIFTSGPQTWPRKNVRVQIPHINTTLAHGFSQLQEERLECSVEGGPNPHQLQPIVQVVTFSIDHEEVVYSVATGAQVNQGGRTSSFRHLNRPFVTSPVAPFRQTPSRINNPNIFRYSSAELVFDRPFFVYLHDQHQGPFAFNAISNNFHEGQRRARHHDSPFDFSDATKAHRWNCQQ